MTMIEKWSTTLHTKMKFSIKDFFSKCDQIRRKLINLIFCAVKSLVTGGHAGAPFTDLSKAFDCIEYEFFIVKLNAYIFDTDALKLIYSYLRRRK